MHSKNNSQKGINRKIKLYSTLALSSLATEGISQISYTNIKDSVLVNHGDFFDIDLNTDGTNDLRVTITKNTFTSVSTVAMTSQYTRLRRVTANGLNSGEVNVISSSSNYAAGFNLSNNIASNVNSWLSDGIMVNQEVASSNGAGKASFTYGEFDDVKDKYLGIRFDINGSTHYGWVRLDLTKGVDSVIIKDYAYESTAATAIDAGDTGSVAVGLVESALKQNDLYFSNGNIQLKGNIASNSLLRIYDLAGKLVQEETVSASNAQIGLQSNYKGVYIVELRNGKSVFRKKLWLEKN